MKKRHILKYPVGRSRVRPDLVPSHLEKSRSSYLVVSNAPWSVPLGWILVAHLVCALITVLVPAHLVRIPVSVLARLEWVCILNLVLISTRSRVWYVQLIFVSVAKNTFPFSVHIFGRYPMVQLEATFRKCRYIYCGSILFRYWPMSSSPGLLTGGQ